MTQTDSGTTNEAHRDDPPRGWSGVVSSLEREMRAHLGTATGGLALDDYIVAFADWYSNFIRRGDKVMELGTSAASKLADSLLFAQRAFGVTPLDPADGASPSASSSVNSPEGAAWHHWPFNVYARTWNNLSSWWQQAVGAAPGALPSSSQRVGFVGAQVLEAFSPRNYLATNPELLEQTRAEGGQNLLRGYRHWLEDKARALSGPQAERDAPFQVGRDVALTPGKVVLRNEVLELIQYAPTTATVYAEPILKIGRAHV